MYSADGKNFRKSKDIKIDLESKLNSALANLIRINIENAILLKDDLIKSKNLEESQKIIKNMAIEYKSLESWYQEEVAEKESAWNKMEGFQKTVSH